MATYSSTNILLYFATILGNVAGQSIHHDYDANLVPFIASIQESGTHKCSGCLLTLSDVLTACQCTGKWVKKSGSNVYKMQVASPKNFAVHTGREDLEWTSTFTQIRKAKRLHAHPKCGKANDILEWDFGVVETDKPFNWTLNVQPIKLYSTDRKSYEALISKTIKQNQCWLFGWNQETSTSLEIASVKIVKAQECRSLFKNTGERQYEAYATNSFDRKAQLCAQGRESSCNVDLGGPCICNGTLVGVVSYRCGGIAGIPVIHAKVSDFVEWYGKVFDGYKRSSTTKSRISLALLNCTVLIYLLRMLAFWS